MSQFSERLTALRKQKGIAQAAAAKELNVALRGLQNYEYGDTEPRLSILIRMADFYGVSIDYLAGRTDNCGGRPSVPPLRCENDSTDS